MVTVIEKAINGDFTQIGYSWKLNEKRKLPMGQFQLREFDDFVELWCFGLEKRFRGKGYAIKMLKDAMSLANNKKMRLFVNKDNEIAKHIYQKAGFEVVREANSIITMDCSADNCSVIPKCSVVDNFGNNSPDIPKHENLRSTYYNLYFSPSGKNVRFNYEWSPNGWSKNEDVNTSKGSCSVSIREQKKEIEIVIDRACDSSNSYATQICKDLLDMMLKRIDDNKIIFHTSNYGVVSQCEKVGFKMVSNGFFGVELQYQR